MIEHILVVILLLDAIAMRWCFRKEIIAWVNGPCGSIGITRAKRDNE